MSKLAQLTEKRNELVKALEQQRATLKAQGGVWKDDQEKTWNESNAAYDAHQEEIRKYQATEEVDRRMADIEAESRKANNPNRIGRADSDDNPIGQHKGISEETRCHAFAGFIRQRAGDAPRKHERKAMQECGYRSGGKMTLDLPDTQTWGEMREAVREGHHSQAKRNSREALKEQRAQSAITLNTGGILVPETLVRELNINLLTYGRVEQVASVVVTQDGGQMVMPSVDDTSNEGRMVSENSDQSSNVTDLAFGGLTLSAYKFSSDFLKVPTELLEDNAIDLAGRIGAILGERLARGENRKFTTGTGASQPQGVITGATLGKTAASATAFTFNEILDLEHSVDPGYRIGASYMFHDTILAAIRKLTDSSGGSGFGSYIFGGNVNAPDRLNGYPIYINNHMASTVATTNKTILFGDFKKYIIRRVRGMRLRILMERFAESDQVAYIGLDRCDGGVFSAGTAPLKYLQQA